MLRLNAFVPPDRVDAVGSALTDVQGVRHVVLGGSTSEGLMCLTAEVDGVAADEATELLAGFGLDWRNVTVSRAASIRPLVATTTATTSMIAAIAANRRGLEASSRRCSRPRPQQPVTHLVPVTYDPGQIPRCASTRPSLIARLRAAWSRSV